MNLHCPIGRFEGISHRSSVQYDVAGPASRVVRAHGTLWPSHERYTVLHPIVSRQHTHASRVLTGSVGPTMPISVPTAPPMGVDTPACTATAHASSSAGSCAEPQEASEETNPEGGNGVLPSDTPQSALANGLSSSDQCQIEAHVANTTSELSSTEVSTPSELLEADLAAASAEPSPSVVLPTDPATLNSEEVTAARSPVESTAEAEASGSGSRTSWPGRRDSDGQAGRPGNRMGSHQARSRELPPYANALTSIYVWPRPKPNRIRPIFLQDYPVPAEKTFNVNSFLGKGDPHRGQYLVPEQRYREFMASYASALEDGYQMYLTENYHQRVFKYFLEFDWDWDTDLALVMEVTPQLVTLATQVASDFYSFTYANVITSIRTPYKIHLNFPQLLTTELLACMCRDRLLEACVERLGPRYEGRVEWERLIDFPHGSFRLMGSRKASHMDSDPAWVREKAYHPARLTENGRWQPGRITPALLAAASIFPLRHQVAAFEKSRAYLDMIYSDLEAYQKKMEERRLERARRRAEREQHQQEQQQLIDKASRGPIIPNLPPGSSKNPLYVQLKVQPDETVVLKLHVKSRFRHKDQQNFVSSRTAGATAAGTGTETDTGSRAQEQAATAVVAESTAAAAVGVSETTGAVAALDMAIDSAVPGTQGSAALASH